MSLWITALVSRSASFSFIPNYQVSNMTATDRDGAIDEVAKVLAKGLQWNEEEQERLVANVIRREELGSTAIGHGLAIPHAAVDWGDHCVSVIGYAPEGIHFEALDGKPVHTIILIAYSRSRRNEQIRLLEQVSRAMRSVR
jgi:PTS system fructose-specific IIA component/PTS system nitrogen regulatory IIA component